MGIGVREGSGVAGVAVGVSMIVGVGETSGVLVGGCRVRVGPAKVGVPSG